MGIDISAVVHHVFQQAGDCLHSDPCIGTVRGVAGRVQAERRAESAVTVGPRHIAVCVVDRCKFLCIDNPVNHRSGTARHAVTVQAGGNLGVVFRQRKARAVEHRYVFNPESAATAHGNAACAFVVAECNTVTDLDFSCGIRA